MSTMDTTGFDQVGRYGTLSLLKKRSDSKTTSETSNATSDGATNSTAQQVITSFGIDSANLTFGREMSCDVRLYYFSIDPVHCRLINEDGKAFLVVQGKAGALVDGCWVYPHTSSADNASQEPQQSIIPLVNNSEFEIQGKRFRFTYPPKEIRKVLLNTPVAVRNRKLRLSMIQSAQVFTPRPSKDPRENLRILQSPIKANIFGVSDATADRSRSQSPHKPRAVSPLKFGVHADDEDSDEEMDEGDRDGNDNERGRPENAEESIVLVHTNHPRVVEEDRDLVILEDVPLHLILPSPSVYNTSTPTRPQRPTDQAASPTPAQRQAPTTIVAPQPQQAQAQPPRTPRRRGGNALHRAVLIRSAQRAVWRAEKEKEEEEEEMEVLGAVVGGGDVDEEQEDVEMEDVEMHSISDEEDEEGDDDDDDDDEEGNYSDEDHKSSLNKPLWRKSLERIIPWPFSPKKNTPEPDGGYNDEEDEDEEKDSVPAALPQQKTPPRKTLGSFMTPQPEAQQALRRNLFPSADTESNDETTSNGTSTSTIPGPGRYSLGGGEARRVLIQQPWRVKDLVVPPHPSTTVPLAAMGSRDPPPTPNRDLEPPPLASTSSRRVTEEERRAIQERRRSAVREVREDSFWKDGAPGMSPSKVRPSPAKPPTGLGVGGPSGSRPSLMGSWTPGRPLFASPTKGRTLEFSIAEAEKEDADSPFLDRDSSKGKSKAVTPKPTSTHVDDDDDSLDTHGLLERMRETVEDMKRRRSIVTPARLPATPVESQHSIFKLTGTTPRESVKKIDFSRIAPQPSKGGSDASMLTSSHDSVLAPSLHDYTPPHHEYGHEENREPNPQPFSLLLKTPVSLESQAMEVEETSVVPAIAVDDVEALPETPQEPEADAEVGTKTRGRSRVLKIPKKEPETEPVEENAEKKQDVSQSEFTAKSKPPSSSAKPRSRNVKSTAPVEPESTAAGLLPEPSGSGTRRTRSRTPQPPAEVEAETEERIPRSATRRTRQATAEPAEAPSQTKRRGKKAAESETEEVTDSEQIKPILARRGRKPRTVAAAIDEEQDNEPTAPNPTPATIKRGRPKKNELIIVPEENEDGDELDSYNVNAAGAEDAPATSSITAKPREIAVAKGRKKEMPTAIPAVKQEMETNDEEAPPLAATRGGRGTRANAATATTPATKTPATVKSKIPMASKTRGRPKTPATAPAATTAASSSNANAEKENTPGTRSGSNGSDEAAEDTTAVKVRVTRRTGTATTTAITRQTKSASKPKPKTIKAEEAGQEEPERTTRTTRTTRVMRTRTKTG